jgi:uncharacterized protein (TIGR02421 family)
MKSLGMNALEIEDNLEKLDAEVSSLFLKLTPINLENEKKKFFENKNYNPAFKYKPSKLSNTSKKILKDLLSVKFSKSPISKLTSEKIASLKKCSAMLETIGTSKFSFTASKYYGLPSKDLISKAKSVLEKNKITQDKTTNSEEAFKTAEECLARFGLKEWKVEYREMVPLAMVQAGEKKIYVKKDAVVPVNFLKRMIVHEIGTHVFRSENGRMQPYKIFSLGTEGYLETEEGLAANVEEMHGCLDEKTFRTYAGRVAAVDYARKKSFRETYDMLLKYFDAEDAWQITLRVKRGMADTSKPGCYPKDHLYLKGYYSVKKFLKQKDGLKTLFIGKISITQANVVKKIHGVQEPKYLPEKMI